MTKDEALKLALEALEYRPLGATSGEKDLNDRAITAIREALASSVATNDTSQERVDETAKQRHEAQPDVDRRSTESKETFDQQEPVAYLDEGLGAFYWAKDYKKHVGFKPLYTTQPHRKPLTDEEIAKIASTPCAVVGSYVHTFARAIEAAHGIKE